MLTLFKLTRYIIDDWPKYQEYRYLICLNQIKTIGYSKKNYMIKKKNSLSIYISFYNKYWRIKADRGSKPISYKLSIRNGSSYAIIHRFEKDNRYVINQNGYNYCFENYRDGIFNVCHIAGEKHFIDYVKINDAYIPYKITVEEESGIIRYHNGHYFRNREYELHYNKDLQLTMIYEKNYNKLYVNNKHKVEHNNLNQTVIYIT
jgi:hypothetical protein